MGSRKGINAQKLLQPLEKSKSASKYVSLLQRRQERLAPLLHMNIVCARPPLGRVRSKYIGSERGSSNFIQCVLSGITFATDDDYANTRLAKGHIVADADMYKQLLFLNCVRNLHVCG